MNQHREYAGLHTLEYDPKLYMIARANIQDMANRDYYYYDTPEGLAPTERQEFQTDIVVQRGYDTPEGLAPTERADMTGHKCIKDRYGGKHYP